MYLYIKSILLSFLPFEMNQFINKHFLLTNRLCGVKQKLFVLMSVDELENKKQSGLLFNKNDNVLYFELCIIIINSCHNLHKNKITYQNKFFKITMILKISKILWPITLTKIQIYIHGHFNNLKTQFRNLSIKI